jgi:NTP pyrophosphatase (non-canonical NTP hydrolase)
MNNEAICKIADHYGFPEQSRQLAEECSELIVAVNKLYRILASKHNPFFDEVAIERNKAIIDIMEEIADVTIMLEQIKHLLKLNDNDIELFIEQKLNRQLERIEKNE